MAWETRNGGRQAYYYAKERRGGRVVSRYVGRGAAAEFAEGDVAFMRAEREAAWQRLRDARAEAAQARRDHAELEAAIAAALAAELEAEGFHRHKREWRRRRGAA